MVKELTQAVVEEFISLATGPFSTKDIWQTIGIVTPAGKTHLRVILGRLETKKIIVSVGHDGTYRRVQQDAPTINWQEADPNKTIDLVFPFEIENFVKVFPKSIIIVAGTKNSGKTAFLYNFIQMNMANFKIDLYNSETSPEQMHERFQPLDIPYPAPFEVFERYDNFADIIDPDKVSVIDYLDVGSEVYMVGAEIDAIFRKLRQGVAVIALQKPPPSVIFVRGVKKLIERDLAYGGAFTAKRAILYISLGSNQLKLLYVKTPRGHIDPNNMQFRYTVSKDGVHFENIRRYYEEDDH